MSNTVVVPVPWAVVANAGPSRPGDTLDGSADAVEVVKQDAIMLTVDVQADRRDTVPLQIGIQVVNAAVDEIENKPIHDAFPYDFWKQRILGESFRVECIEHQSHVVQAGVPL